MEEFSLPFQQGVLAVAREADPDAIFQDHITGALRARAINHWRNLLKRPDRSLVHSYFALKSNEQFGHGSVSDQSAVPSLANVMLSPFSSSRRQELISYLTYSQWAEGMLHRDDLGLPSRLLFYVLMKVALKYKVMLHAVRSNA